MPLCHLYDQLTKNIKGGEISCELYLDLKKAFDTVSIDILLQKLDFIGIKGNAFNIFSSYLSNRHQRTRVNNIVSEDKLVKIGIPQGSILGPLLFILYINDMPKVSSAATFYLFADDTTITIKAKNTIELQEKIDDLVPKITRWFHANRLSINASKTNYQIYSANYVNYINIVLNNCFIGREKCIKYLGVLVDENLKWHSHIKHVSAIISRNLGIMSRASFYLSSCELKLLYNSLILPHLNYCAVIWGSNYKTSIDRILILQKRAVRIIDKKPYLYPSNELFIKHDLIKFSDIVKEQNIYVLLGLIKGTLPNSIANMFELYTQENPRVAQHFKIPFAATNYCAFSISITAPKCWNQIVCSVFKNTEDMPVNKKTLKKHIRKYMNSRYRQLQQ